MPVVVASALPADRFPKVQFVSAPDPAATVRFDFNKAGQWADEDSWPGHEGFTLGAPSLEGDPDGIGTEYGFRRIDFSLVIRGDNISAQVTMSKLARELQRQTNWLLFQASPASSPVWFKTYRTAPGDVDFGLVNSTDDTVSNVWGVAVVLDADAHALGELVTLSTVTIANDPAAASNPMSCVLPTILGDAPAPLAVIAYPSAATKSRMLVSNIGSDAIAAPYFWQASAFTLGTDATSTTGAATFSGGNYVGVSFATDATMVTRLSGNLPTKPPAGRYKFLARVARSDTSSTFDLKFSTGYNGTDIYEGPVVRVSGTADAATWATLVDLGEFELPVGADDGTLIATGSYSDLPIDLSAQRISGSGSLRVDYLLAVPVQVGPDAAGSIVIDDPSAANIGDQGTQSAYYADGDAERLMMLMYVTGSSPVVIPNAAPIGYGDFPEVVPGVKNTLHLVMHVDPTFRYYGVFNSGTNADVITHSVQVRCYYRPRYLYLSGD